MIQAKRFGGVLVLGGFGMLACAHPSERRDGASAARAILSELLEKSSAPGVQYMRVDATGVLFSFAGGTADLERGVPVTSDTTFSGYSVTKTFTAVAVLKLAAEGRLDLDAPISRYLDHFPYPISPTVRETLQHIGGFPNPIPIAWVHPAAEHDVFDEQAFIREVLGEHDELDTAPGEAFKYSNVGYLLLGEVVRRVSGKPYADYVRDHVIAPLGLGPQEALSFTIDDERVHARGYIRRMSLLNAALGFLIDRAAFLGQPVAGWVPFRHTLVNGAAYGGLVGNAAGFARYAQALLRKEPPFTETMIEQLFTVGTTKDAEPLPVGLSWFKGELEGEPYFAHAGGGGGFYCEVRIYPRRKQASVVMFNRTGIRDERVLDQIDVAFLGQDGAS